MFSGSLRDSEEPGELGELLGFRGAGGGQYVGNLEMIFYFSYFSWVILLDPCHLSHFLALFRGGGTPTEQ